MCSVTWLTLILSVCLVNLEAKPIMDFSDTTKSADTSVQMNLTEVLDTIANTETHTTPAEKSKPSSDVHHSDNTVFEAWSTTETSEIYTTPAEKSDPSSIIFEAMLIPRHNASANSDVDQLLKRINRINEEFTQKTTANGDLDYITYLDALRQAFIQFRKAHAVTTTEPNYVHYGW